MPQKQNFPRRVYPQPQGLEGQSSTPMNIPYPTGLNQERKGAGIVLKRKFILKPEQKQK